MPKQLNIIEFVYTEEQHKIDKMKKPIYDSEYYKNLRNNKFITNNENDFFSLTSSY